MVVWLALRMAGLALRMRWLGWVWANFTVVLQLPRLCRGLWSGVFLGVKNIKGWIFIVFAHRSRQACKCLLPSSNKPASFTKSARVTFGDTTDTVDGPWPAYLQACQCPVLGTLRPKITPEVWKYAHCEMLKARILLCYKALRCHG